MIQVPLTDGYAHVAGPDVADPCLRADAIWEALTRVRSAADQLGDPEASACADIARRLEEGCDGSAEPPAGEELTVYARRLDRI